ncbi:tyrosine-type recombinase/integrase [Thermoproteota archaeon]
MQLSAEEFFDSIRNKSTRKGYRNGIKKFCHWYNKSPSEILELRKDDLTQRPNENLIEYRNRAARFEKEIEKFHSHMLDEGHSINSSRNYTIGIRQLFRFYQMPVRMRAGSQVTRTVKTSKSFPLRIEHVRQMFEVADLRERVILSMATDLGLRTVDFIDIKKKDLPNLNQEAPIPFDIMTAKEDVVAHGYLDQESVDLLKTYLPVLAQKKKDNSYLFASNGLSHFSEEWLNKLLKKLGKKAQIPIPNGKKLSFHCFRKMFLSSSIDSGIGLTAGKMMCGKAIAQTDETYLTTVKLRERFKQLKRFLTITEQSTVESENIESLNNAVNKLQEDMTQQKTINEVITKQNINLKRNLQSLKDCAEKKDAIVEKLKSENEILTSKIQQLPALQSKVERLEKSTLFSRTWDELTKETAAVVLKEIRDETKRAGKDP